MRPRRAHQAAANGPGERLQPVRLDVFVLRCTLKLLERMGHAVAKSEAPRSTARLGDWTANVLVSRESGKVQSRSKQLVLAVSNVTLLPVLLHAAPFKTVPSRLPEAVGQMLRALRIEPQSISSELAAMNECIVAPTNDRRVLGSMNDFDRMLEAYLDGRPLVQVALHLSEAPCSPIGMERPKDVARELFSAPAVRLARG